MRHYHIGGRGMVTIALGVAGGLVGLYVAHEILDHTLAWFLERFT